jgi:hypothetical protein
MGRIVTVSDSAGRSVTVSNWGVAQTSRHQKYPQRFPLKQNTVVCTIGIQEYTVINHSADKHKSDTVNVMAGTETHCHDRDSNLIPECAKHD